jgi:hypothetical protein
LLVWEEELGEAEMFYLVEGGGRRLLIYFLGPAVALSTGRTLRARGSVQTMDATSASHPCHDDGPITPYAVVVQARQLRRIAHSLPQAHPLSAQH